MKILVVSQYWDPENGVPQRRWAWFSKILQDAGHEITVVTPPPHYLRDVSLHQWWRERGFEAAPQPEVGRSGERIIRSGFFPGGQSITQKALNQAAVALGALHAVLRPTGPLKGYTPDLVVGTVPAIPTAFVAQIAAKRYRVPYMIDLRDAWPELLSVSGSWNAGTGPPSLRQRLLSHGPLQVVSFITGRGLNRVLKRAALVMVTSRYLELDLCERFAGEAVAGQRKAVTVRNVFPPQTVVTKHPDLNGGSAVLNVLYAGTLGRAQNLHNALKAAALARDHGLTVYLRLVGAGAAKKQLIRAAEELGVAAQFENRRSADNLAEHYQWADTALVHLTDWGPLTHAVPSKTYEIMSQRLHISGVVAGETAELITELAAGDVVAPEDPAALAQLWLELSEDRSRLVIGTRAAQWIENERQHVAPKVLLECVEKVGGTA